MGCARRAESRRGANRKEMLTSPTWTSEAGKYQTYIPIHEYGGRCRLVVGCYLIFGPPAAGAGADTPAPGVQHVWSLLPGSAAVRMGWQNAEAAVHHSSSRLVTARHGSSQLICSSSAVLLQFFCSSSWRLPASWAAEHFDSSPQCLVGAVRQDVASACLVSLQTRAPRPCLQPRERCGALGTR